MSLRALSWALDAPIDSHGAKLLLIAIANYADDRGQAWPGQETLQRHVRANRKSIIRWISQLEAEGYLERKRRGGDGSGRRSNLYQLAIDEPKQSPTGDTSTAGQSPTQDTKGKVPLGTLAKSHSDPSKVPLVTHEPLEEPLGEPSEGEARASDAPSTPQKKTKRGSRLDLEALPEDWRAYCSQKRPDLDPDETWDDFRDYWTSIPGQRGYKVDWLATWRRWVRNQHTSANGTDLPRPNAHTRAQGDLRLSDKAIARAARPGETWEQARKRLLCEG